jgi:hypothetical protein
MKDKLTYIQLSARTALYVVAIGNVHQRTVLSAELPLMKWALYAIVTYNPTDT